MELIINFFKIIYNLITFRYLTILKMKNELPDSSIYKNIVQEELDFYYFYNLTGYFERNSKEREKYLNFYNKNKLKIDMQFKEFVSMRHYMEIDNSNDTIQIDLKKSNMHIFGKFFFIVVLILFIGWVYLFVLIDSINLLKFLLGSVCLIIFLFMFISFIEPYERAERYKNMSKI